MEIIDDNGRWHGAVAHRLSARFDGNRQKRKKYARLRERSGGALRAQSVAIRRAMRDEQNAAMTMRRLKKHLGLLEEAQVWGRSFKIRGAKARPVQSKTKAKKMSAKGTRSLPAYRKPLKDKRGRIALFMAISYVGLSSAKWRSGLPADHIYYISREEAIEIAAMCAGIISNMGVSTDEIGQAWDALEEVEKAYRANAIVQHRFVVNLPDGLSPAGRERVLTKFCEKSFGRYGLPYVAVPHLPDPAGNRRNFHGHICISARPLERTGDHEWMVGEEKISGFTDPKSLKRIRAEFAAVLNRECRREGLEVRFTHQNYKERGIDAKRQEHYGPERTALHRNGEAVEMVVRNQARVERNETKAAIAVVNIAAQATTKLEELVRWRLSLLEKRKMIRRRMKVIDGVLTLVDDIAVAGKTLWPRSEASVKAMNAKLNALSEIPQPFNQLDAGERHNDQRRDPAPREVTLVSIDASTRLNDERRYPAHRGATLVSMKAKCIAVTGLAERFDRLDVGIALDDQRGESAHREATLVSIKAKRIAVTELAQRLDWLDADTRINDQRRDPADRDATLVSIKAKRIAVTELAQRSDRLEGGITLNNQRGIGLRLKGQGRGLGSVDKHLRALITKVASLYLLPRQRCLSFAQQERKHMPALLRAILDRQTAISGGRTNFLAVRSSARKLYRETQSILGKTPLASIKTVGVVGHTPALTDLDGANKSPLTGVVRVSLLVENPATSQIAGVRDSTSGIEQGVNYPANGSTGRDARSADAQERPTRALTVEPTLDKSSSVTTDPAARDRSEQSTIEVAADETLSAAPGAGHPADQHKSLPPPLMTKEEIRELLKVRRLGPDQNFRAVGSLAANPSEVTSSGSHAINEAGSAEASSGLGQIVPPPQGINEQPSQTRSSLSPIVAPVHQTADEHDRLIAKFERARSNEERLITAAAIRSDEVALNRMIQRRNPQWIIIEERFRAQQRMGATKGRGKGE